MLDLLIGMIPLTGILGGLLFLSNMQPSVEQWGIKNPLEYKGIFDPIQKAKLALTYLFADFLWKVNIFKLACSWSEEDCADYDFIASFYGMFVIIVSIFLLCRTLLPNIEIRRIRKTSNTTNYSLWGVTLSAIFFVDVILSLSIQHSTCWYVNELLSLLFSMLCICLGFILSLRPFIIFKRYDRIKGESERTLSSLLTHRAPIIFLRSFEIDKFLIHGYSFDEYICKSFSMTAQPIISLSDPNDFLPTGGSIKIQSFDERWKDAIITLFKSCRAVVIFEGKSEGLQWEIENLKKYISYDQLFIATPPKKYRYLAWCRGKTKKEKKYAINFIWHNFAKHLDKEGFKVPVSDPGSDILITFNKKWVANHGGVSCKGMRLFDYILENTVKYEKRYCDYNELAQTIAAYELTLRMPDKEKKRVDKAMFKIISIVIIAMLCVSCFV